MVDVAEILQHWYAGRPKVEVARSLGVDAKTVRRYVAPAEAAGMAPGGPPVNEEQWRVLVRDWSPQLARTGSGRCPGGRSRFIMTGSSGCCPWCRCR